MSLTGLRGSLSSTYSRKKFFTKSIAKNTSIVLSSAKTHGVYGSPKHTKKPPKRVVMTEKRIIIDMNRPIGFQSLFNIILSKNAGFSPIALAFSNS